MKKYLLSFFVFALLVSSVLAGTWSWSNSGYSMGSYVPISGSFSEDWYYGIYESSVSFTLDASNVSSIITYNNGNGTGGTCYGDEAYLTIDMSADPDGLDLEIDANSIYSNTPNPKYDIETDWLFTPDHEESETCVLGTVSATNYYMTTCWIDERDGGENDGGDILVRFSMSKEGVFDYNNCVQSSENQILNPYGNEYGDE